MAPHDDPEQPVRHCDPEEVVRAKQRSREADARALASGEKTREQLRAENTFVSVSYDELVICHPGSLR